MEALDGRPRTELATTPTPLRAASNLRAALSPDGPGLFLKLDEQTGFALGGNKVRKLEYELAPDRLRGVTHLITTGGVQSNHARVTAGAAARLGLRCILVLNGEPPDPPTGNALLQRLFGADVRTVPSRDDRAEAMDAAAREVEGGGGRALVVPLGASTPVGALGYVRAAREIHEQLPPDDATLHVVLASSSGGTLAGLVAGFTLLGRADVRLLGVSADVPRGELVEVAADLARGAMAELGSDAAILEGLLDATDAQVGPGYGVPTVASREAADLLARTEGVAADPVYTAKAAAALVDAVRRGRFDVRDRVLFLHTGGHPALFA